MAFSERASRTTPISGRPNLDIQGSAQPGVAYRRDCVRRRIGALPSGWVVVDLEIALLGEISIRHDGEPVACPSARALELLGYLLTHRGRSHPRKSVSAVLWPQEDPQCARRYLRQALWKLNAAMRGPTGGSAGGSAGGGAGREFVTSPSPSWLRVDPAAYSWLDLDILERAAQAVGGVPGPELSDAQAHEVDIALRCYRGDLLASWHQEWCLTERVRVQEIYLELAERMIGYCDSRRLFAKGLDYGRMVLDRDPARETTHRRLMRLHQRAGDRPAAVRQYQQCAAALADEFGVGPSAPTVLLHRSICADDAMDAVPQPPPTPVRSGPQRADRLAALHRQVDEIQATVEALTRALGSTSGRNRQG
jgi:DNA-binding SARP family transcriptional activator